MARLPLASVYLSALAAGLVIVGFPASATVLKATLDLTDAQYGTIFLPQVAATIAGSLAGGALARRIGAHRLLRLALLAFALAEGALFLTGRVGAGAGYPCLLGSTALAGLGFGLAAAPLNTYPGELLPKRAQAALVALHTVLGGGFALGPVIVGALDMRGLWSAYPVALVALLVVILLLSLGLAPLRDADRAGAAADAPTSRGAPLGLFLAMAVLYAFAEGTFANWGTFFLNEERNVSAADAAFALSVFWAALAVGRLLVSALLLRVPARVVWLALPALMAVAFVALPSASGPVSGLVLFALAGLSCSAFFPLTVGLAVESDPGRGAFVSSAMTAALMAGVGLGSFVVGPLRGSLTIAQIYLISVGYPVVTLALALFSLRSNVRPAPSTRRL